MESHVLTPEILKIIKRYETLRMSRSVPDMYGKDLKNRAGILP